MNESSQTITSALQAMNDVPGYAGSLLFTSSGEAIEADLLDAAFIELLQAQSQRLARMLEAIPTQEGRATSFLARYESALLMLVPVSDCILLVLADPSTNVAMLRTAATVAARRILQVATSLQRSSSAMASPVEAPDPSVAQEGEGGGSKEYQVVYRGIRIK